MRFEAILPALYQIPAPAGNHSKSFTDKTAFYAFRFMFCCGCAPMIAQSGKEATRFM
jgi:hypothetical protein